MSTYEPSSAEQIATNRSTPTVDGHEVTIAGSTRRGNIAAVAVDVPSKASRFLVVLSWDQGQWITPTLINGIADLTSNRSQRTSAAVNSVSNLMTVQMDPGAGSIRPKTAFIAVSGSVALDAASATITSASDSCTLSIDDDGFFLGLINAKWGEQPSMTITTLAGVDIAIGPVRPRPV